MRWCSARPRTPLEWLELPDPVPGPGQVRVRIGACGVCRTDLHVIDGELPEPKLPIIPGHQIVGRVEALGTNVDTLKLGQRVGIPWLGHTCGHCAYCLSGRENLCDQPLFTGYTRDGGFATATVADARFALPLAEPGPMNRWPRCCAPDSSAGARCAWPGMEVASACTASALRHISWRRCCAGRVERCSRLRAPGISARRRLRTSWVQSGPVIRRSHRPEPLDAAIIFAPDGALVPRALRAVRKGGRVVCAGIHMSDIPSFPYQLLWEERQLLSVANLTRQDGIEFLDIAPKAGIRTTTACYPLRQANQALADLRAGRFEGAAVLVP